ncbi:MAG: cell division protein ZapE [Trueperaceae bacterium]|nr:cell division protein ZapE [Trueperaceae bacterium]
MHDPTRLAVADLAAPTPRGASLASFVPPPRFGTTDFASYAPSDPTQATARDRVAAFAEAAAQPRRSAPWRRRRSGAGLYLDGGFGVGKTHLLAAAWHAAPLPEAAKRYLSFQELVFVLGVLGRDGAAEAFADVRLLCLDEFELDDPGNTLLIATFLRGAFARGTDVLTTSNTDPAAQGRGRFAAQDFRREIQGIADRFEVVRLEGPDHRAGRREGGWTPSDALDAAVASADGTVAVGTGADLHGVLERHHPVRYRDVLAGVDALALRDLAPIAGQNEALRFVHFVDKAYDLGVGLRAHGTAPPEALFDARYREGAYAKKHHRALSRLAEMLADPFPRGAAR